VAVDSQPNALIERVWEQLAGLRPSLPRHTRIQMRHYRGQKWYLLQDLINGRFHRFSPTAYRLLSLMDGKHTLEQVLAESDPRSEAESASRTQLVELLQYLHVADLLHCNVPPDAKELFDRRDRHKQAQWQRFLLNPMFLRFKLADPDAWLSRCLPLARGLTRWPVAWIWSMVVGYALLQAITNWSQLSASLTHQVLAPQNLLWLWFTYPLLKICHELGHALFTKAGGGEVHELGIALMMGIPLPYVDASAATGFTCKRQRLMVSAAGMAVELLLAALALLLWLEMEAGQLRDLLFNVVLLGSVSTLFFNGNPLMRFDGYYLLTDALDLPNLASRANKQIAYLVQRHGFGLRDLTSQANSCGEALGLGGYAISAFLYRLAIIGAILLLVMEHFLTLGIILAIWLLLSQILLPLVKLVNFLLNSPRLQLRRARAVVLSTITVGAVLLMFFYLPMPLDTRVEGVLWLPENAQVRAHNNGFIQRLMVSDGDSVTQGQVLIATTNPSLSSRLAIKQAQLREQQARLQAAWLSDRGQAKFINEDIAIIEAEINDLKQRMESLTIRSPATGRLVLPDAHNLPGRYLRQGDPVAFIIQSAPTTVRVALAQHEIGLVRRDSQQINVKLAERLDTTLVATIRQEVPAATHQLPSRALGSAGGGQIAVNPFQGEGTQTQQQIFLLDLQLPKHYQEGRYGERAYVRFVHQPEPWAQQCYRLLRQLFLRRLNR